MKRYTKDEIEYYCKLVDELGYSQVHKLYGIYKATLKLWKDPDYKLRCRSKTASWIKKNPNYLKNWNKENKGYSTQKNKEWILKNSERNKEMHKKHYLLMKNNPTKYKEKIKKDIIYSLKRYKSDKKYKILCCLRSRLICALKGEIKKETTMSLLGCDIDFLMDYLAKKFQDGMNWDNYGKWHIDHIKPCAAYNMLNETDRKECFHYSNLQPLWAEDNFRKSDKYD